MNFGEQVKKIRKERNMTQQEMADKLNVSRQAVSNWENDKNLPDIEMLITMAQMFQITLDELILGGTNMNNMTEKLINDGSTNNRIKMNLLGIKIGSGLIAAGCVSFFAGIFARPSIEKYWGTAFTVMMFCGMLTFLVIGMRNVVELIKNREQLASGKAKLFATGGTLLLAGILLYAFSLLTGLISGIFGLIAMSIGMLILVIAALKSVE